MKDSYWEGNGWSVLNLGRIGEIRLNSGDEEYTYILVFSNDNEGKLYSEKISSNLQDLDESKIKSSLEEYFNSLGCRTILEKEDLLMMQGAVKIPEFYKQALEGDVTKIIIF